MGRKPRYIIDYLRRYPKIVEHIITESRFDISPNFAAEILRDAKENRENRSFFINFIYGGNPKILLKYAIENRHEHYDQLQDQ